MTTVLLVHAFATVAMVGLIWFVQIVHYPLMARVGREQFAAYHEGHVRRTGWVVVPLMVAEAITMIVVVTRQPPGAPVWGLWLAFALLVVAWTSTAWLQVPLHRRLARGYDDSANRLLVITNWIRTAAWSARALIVVWMTAVVLGAPAST
jgi:hypothetical protein